MLNSIIGKLIKSFFSEEHIEGQIKMWLAGIGAMLINNGFETSNTWSKTCGIIMAAIAMLYHFIQSHNNNQTPKQ